MNRNYDEIEKLKFAISNLVSGLNAVSIDLDDYLIIEDLIFNEHFDIAVDTIIKLPNVSNEDKLSLTYIFNHASEDYAKLSN